MTETHLDLDLLVNSFLLLDALLFLLLNLILEVNLDAQRIPELVDAGALSTNDAANILAVDLELNRLGRKVETGYVTVIEAATYVARDNLIVLSVLNDLLNFLCGTVNIRAGTTNEDDIFSRGITCLCADFNRERLVLTNDAVRQSV